MEITQQGFAWVHVQSMLAHSAFTTRHLGAGSVSPCVHLITSQSPSKGLALLFVLIAQQPYTMLIIQPESAYFNARIHSLLMIHASVLLSAVGQIILMPITQLTNVWQPVLLHLTTTLIVMSVSFTAQQLTTSLTLLEGFARKDARMGQLTSNMVIVEQEDAKRSAVRGHGAIMWQTSAWRNALMDHLPITLQAYALTTAPLLKAYMQICFSMFALRLVREDTLGVRSIKPVSKFATMVFGETQPQLCAPVSVQWRYIPMVRMTLEHVLAHALDLQATLIILVVFVGNIANTPLLPKHTLTTPLYHVFKFVPKAIGLPIILLPIILSINASRTVPQAMLIISASGAWQSVLPTHRAMEIVVWRSAFIPAWMDNLAITQQTYACIPARASIAHLLLITTETQSTEGVLCGAHREHLRKTVAEDV